MKYRFSQRGATAVELALILPIVIILLFGAIEFGILMYNQQVITNACREGARAGIVAPTPRLQAYGGDCTIVSNPPQSIECVVKQYAATHLITFGTANDPVTNVTGYASNATFGTDLTVTVSYTYGFFVIWSPKLWKSPGSGEGIHDTPSPVGPTITLTATTVMKYD